MLLNRSRAMDWMQRCRLDALVATHWVNVLYLTDYFLWLQPLFKQYMISPGEGDAPLALFAILPRDGEPAIVLDYNSELNAKHIWVQNRYVFGATQDQRLSTRFGDPEEQAGPLAFTHSEHRFETPFEALSAALRYQGLHNARIGIDLCHLPDEEQHAIRAASPDSQFQEATNLFRLIRMVKSQEEVRRLRRAAQINEDAALDSVRLAKPGYQLQDINQCFRVNVASQGADYDHFAFSQRGIGIATEISATLPPRETLFIDFGCLYQHYFADAGTTLMVGDPPERDLETFKHLCDCLEEASAIIRPGVNASIIQRAMAKSFARAGLLGQFPHGHSVGIEVREYPILAPNSGGRISDQCVDMFADLPLEEGMVINLEAPVFNLHGSAFQLEKSYVLTSSTCEPLTGRDSNEPIIVR